jgi:hypothetical protein
MIYTGLNPCDRCNNRRTRPERRNLLLLDAKSFSIEESIRRSKTDIKGHDPLSPADIPASDSSLYTNSLPAVLPSFTVLMSACFGGLGRFCPFVRPRPIGIYK